MKKGNPFTPSTAFRACNGFFVHAKVEALMDEDKHIVNVKAVDEDGYETIFYAPRNTIEVGSEIDIPGHALLAYGGATGPWATSKRRT